ncbi:hypothetical protein ACSFCK_06580 [Brevibacterium luteolum]|uniref:hypothetical protein n=1 Tax=Brevibacterium luteolum TaxID=199591 RepID=UPI003EECF09B
MCALSDDQLTRAFRHTNRDRAAAELAQARRAEAAAPSPDAVREEEARQLQAVLAAITGRDSRRCQVLERVMMRLLWVWGASLVLIALAAWLYQHFPGAGATIVGLAGFVGICTLIPAIIIRGIVVRAADRYRTKVIETVLEWSSRQPDRLGRGVDGLPSFPGELGPNDWRLYFGGGLLCMAVGAFVSMLPFTAGAVYAGIVSILVAGAPLIACGVGIMRLLKRMERRLERVSELIVALSHPSSEMRKQPGARH